MKTRMIEKLEEELAQKGSLDKRFAESSIGDLCFLTEYLNAMLLHSILCADLEEKGKIAHKSLLAAVYLMSWAAWQCDQVYDAKLDAIINSGAD